MLFETSEIHSLVESMIARHTHFRGVDFLRESGRLGVAGETLDDAFGDRAALAAELDTALEYVAGRGYVPESNAEPASWTTRYVQPSSQMDLFGQTEAHASVQELVDAIVDLDSVQASSLLNALEIARPSLPLVGGAPDLIRAVELARRADESNFGAIEQALESAERFLGEKGVRYRENLSRVIAANNGFSLERRCGALMALEDWRGIVDLLPSLAVDQAPNMLHVGAIATFQLGNLSAALGWFAQLCWEYPQLVNEIDHLADAIGMTDALERWDDRELGNRWGWQELPTWLLLMGKPVPLADNATPAFVALKALKADPSSVENRQRLLAIHPDVLKTFLAALSHSKG